MIIIFLPALWFLRLKSEDFLKKLLTSKTLKIAFEIFKEPITFNLENHKKLYKKYKKHFTKEDNNSKTKDTNIKIDKNWRDI